MATNRQPRVPDAQAMPEIERAMRQIDRLILLVGAPVQIVTTQQVPNELHNWELVGPAMLFSATSCLVSIRWLAESPRPLRDEDASVLIRRLYEHAVDFAWIAVDPAVNAPKWVADDFRHRLEADDDLKLIGDLGLTPQARTEYQEFIDKHGKHGKMPGVAKRANQADHHWSTRLEGHGTFPSAAGQTQSGQWSLRKMYLAVYRSASANVHPSPQSLRDFVWPGGTRNTFYIGNHPSHQIERYPYTMAPLVFATLLLMAEQVLGRPNGNEVRAVFEE